jgi:hypothetical protein
MLPRPLPFVRAIRGRTLLPTMAGGEATASRRGRGSRQSGRQAGGSRSSGPHGGRRDWMLWAAMGLALLATLAGLASTFLP